MELDTDKRNRVVIEGVRPEIDGGQFAIKRVVGECVRVDAHIFGDGHDAISAVLQYRLEINPVKLPAKVAPLWHEVAMTQGYNDEWWAEFNVECEGGYRYTIVAWVDHFRTWFHDLRKRLEAGQVTAVDLAIGAEMLDEAAERAVGEDQERLRNWVRRVRHAEALQHVNQICEDTELEELMRRNSNRNFATTYAHELAVTVDRKRAQFSAWYEMFPRSAADQPGVHGTLKDVEKRLPYVASMGFDVLYLPPIHPVGTAFRKGKNNATQAVAGDVGSPWAIGAKEGGHKAIHPQLGTLDDFRQLVAAAKQRGMELALDIAFQCSPDHPYVKEHPQWFKQRPDGTIQYAENPPKKYQDIYPFDFETADWRALWRELKSIFEYWIKQGVNIFRVDNPHTKPFPFWEWCIGEIKRDHPNVLFLAEAFTRPKLMARLAKLGFSQSYTYFSWRNTKPELTEYLTELTQGKGREFFRPNFWPNTPDILTEYLQTGGRPAFMSRLVLAATLSSNYGIYGPPFEHCWNAPQKPGSEEYLHSEKYQLHHHDLDRPDSLKNVITLINRVRREYSVLQSNENLQFHHVDNDQLICYSKSSADRSEIILVVVNLDPHQKQMGFVHLPLYDLKLEEGQPYQVHDLLSDSRYRWVGHRNFVELRPEVVPAHIFKIRRRVRTERDFEHYA